MSDASRGRRGWRLAGLVAVAVWLIAVAAVGATAWVLADHLDVGETRTPPLVGLPIAEADLVVARAGLQLRSYPVEARGLDADAVVEQSPPAGTVVRSGRVISVGVYVPAEGDRMPSLVGLREEDAAATLRDLSLPSADVRYVASDEPAGRVLSQEPDARRSLADGTRVTLTVSRGEGAAYVELPDLRGLDVEAAVAQATALGLRRVETLPTAIRAETPGIVTVQRPGAGAVVRAGEPLMLGYAVDGTAVVQVPDVVGLELWDARVALIRSGLEIGPTETVRRSDQPRGVVEVRPAGLTVAGAPVVLVVNVGPDEPDVAPNLVGPGEVPGRPGGAGLDAGEAGARDDGVSGGGRAGVADVPDVVGGEVDGGRLVPFTFDPGAIGVRALQDADYDLRLVVRDELGERTVLERRVTAGQIVRTTVVVHGDEPLLQTYVNDVFFQAWRP